MSEIKGLVAQGARFENWGRPGSGLGLGSDLWRVMRETGVSFASAKTEQLPEL